MSFQQGLVVIVTSIKCLYIYFLRNSTNFPHPDLFDKFKTYWQPNYCKSSERVTGPIKKDFCLIQIIYFAKKERGNVFSASNHGFNTTATEMRALEGLSRDLAKSDEIGAENELETARSA